MSKILLLESDWSAVLPDAPARVRSAAKLYAAVLARAQAEILPLHKASWREDLLRFSALPENQRGPNIIVISAHGHWRDKQCVLAAADGQFDMCRELAALRKQLRRSLFILDACNLGRGVEEFQHASGALGVIGFQGSVEWTASNVFVLTLLRAWQAAGVFELKRALPGRAKQVLEKLPRQGYADLMNGLGVRSAFRS